MQIKLGKAFQAILCLIGVASFTCIGPKLSRLLAVYGVIHCVCVYAFQSEVLGLQDACTWLASCGGDLLCSTSVYPGTRFRYDKRTVVVALLLHSVRN